MDSQAPTRMQWELRRYRRPSANEPRSPKRPRGRWMWAVSGVLVTASIGAPIAFTLARAGTTGGDAVFVEPTAVHDITISQAVTSVSVQSYGAPVRVIGAAATKKVRLIESVNYDPQQGPAPSVTDTVSRGLLSLAAPDCTPMDCSVGFTLLVPAGVSVTAVTGGGTVTVSGIATANVDSGGGDVSATSVSGPLTVTSEGGNLHLTGIGGSLKAESGGGDVTALGITGPAVSITTDGGQLSAMGLAATTAILSSGGNDAQAGFASTPDAVVVTTDGGNATVLLPGGPYALTADSGGGQETVGIATDPTARDALTVTTGGGDLFVEPTSGSAPQGGHPSVPVTSNQGKGGPGKTPVAPKAPSAPVP
jgi:hypothetical protein